MAKAFEISDELKEKYIKTFAGKPYRPSNGTEGLIFNEDWCSKCNKDNFDPQTGEGGCQILADTLAYDVGEPEYPKEWQYDKDANPICTAFDASVSLPTKEVEDE